MTQKTVTISGKRFTAKKIDRMMDENNMTNGGDYIITLNGELFYANYRQIQDEPYAPTCSRCDANAIALMRNEGGYYSWSIWLDF